MISAKEYTIKRNELMDEYERKVRDWLKEKGAGEIADKIPFYRDGVTCPEVWFKPGNNFRPLFILKEVSIGKDDIEGLNEYLEEWDDKRTFDFTEYPFDDVKIGKFTTWRKIAALAKGLEDIHKGLGIREYDINEFAYREGGEKYSGTTPGYLAYGARTANEAYNDIMSKIAVLEIKKVGGGTIATKDLSLATRYYSEHITPFRDLICREIELIKPTVVVGCCREFFTGNLLKEVEDRVSDVPWIYGYHPSMTSTENFYYKTVRAFAGLMKK